MKKTLQAGLTHRFRYRVPSNKTVTVGAECLAVDGPRITFKVKAHDGFESISEGRHQRFVVAWDAFNARVADKAKKATVSA